MLKKRLVAFTKKKVFAGIKPPLINGAEIPIANFGQVHFENLDHRLTWNHIFKNCTNGQSDAAGSEALESIRHHYLVDGDKAVRDDKGIEWHSTV